MNELVQVFNGVRGYEQDGVAYLHIEDVARGLGFTTKVNETEYVRWPRVDEYLGDFGFLPQVANDGNSHDYYIPENIFYRLCMKAKNETAEAFQAKVADEIIPSIRKHGMYGTDDFIQRSISDPDWAISVLQQLKFEKEQKELALKQRDEAIRTKAHFVEGRDAKMCGMVGGLSNSNKQLREKNTKLTNENEQLTQENEQLKDECGRGKNWQTVSDVTDEWIEKFGHKPDGKILTKLSIAMAVPCPKDVLRTYEMGNSGRYREGHVRRYRKDVWEVYEQREEASMRN